MAHLTVLMQNKHFEDDFPKLAALIDLENSVNKASPYTNQQKCVQLFEFYITTSKELKFIQEIQTRFNCFCDFDFLNFYEKFFIEKNINIGELLSFDQLKIKKPTISNRDIKIGKYSSTGFKIYNLLGDMQKNLFLRSTYKTAVDRVWANLLVRSNDSVLRQDDWSIVSFNVGHIKQENFFDSRVEFITLCFERQDSTKRLVLNESFFEKFYFISGAAVDFQPVSNEHIFCLDNEIDCISAALLYMCRFNQIIEFFGSDFNVSLLLSRYNKLKCRNSSSKNKEIYLNIFRLALQSPLDNRQNKYHCKYLTFPLSVYVDVTMGIKKESFSETYLDFNFKKRVVCNEVNLDGRLILYLDYSSFDVFIDFCKKFELNRQVVWFSEKNGIIQTKIKGQLENIEFVYNNNGSLDSVSCSQQCTFLSEHGGFIKITLFLQDFNEINSVQKYRCTNLHYKIENKRFIEMIQLKEKNSIQVNVHVDPTWIGFLCNDLEKCSDELRTMNLKDKIRLYSYEASLVFNLSTEVYKDHLKHLNSYEFHCAKYECFYFTLSKISNLILTKEKYTSLIQNKHVTKFQILMFFVTCEIDGRKTKCDDIAKNMKQFNNGKYKEFNTASKISDLFDGEMNMNEQELRFNDEMQVDTHFGFTKYIKDFTENIRN